MPLGDVLGPFGSGVTTFNPEAPVETIDGMAVKPYAPSNVVWNASAALTTTSNVALVAAQGAGRRSYITALQAINTGTAVDLIIRDGSTDRWRLTLPQNVPVSITFPVELITSLNTALNAALSAAGTVRINAQGYTSA